MSALLFISLREMKNQLLQLKRKPGMLILYLVFAALIAVSFVSAGGGLPGSEQGTTDIMFLKLIFLSYLLMFGITSVMTGLKSAGNLFFMSDVNFLFVSPVHPKPILMYGVAKQAARGLFAGFFILMMGNTLNSVWGVGLGGLLLVFAAYTLSLALTQVLTVVIYLYTNESPLAKKLVVIGGILLLLPTTLAVALPILQGMPAGQAAVTAMSSRVLYSLPIFGWITQALFGLLTGSLFDVLLSLLLLAAGVAGMVLLLLKARPDYYEDVLVAAETGWQRQQAAREGNLESAQMGRRRVKAAENQEIWGRGASVFLGKHMVENFRKNPLKLLDSSSLFYIALAVLMAFLQREDGEMLGIACMLMGMKIFLIGTGLGLRELYMHYIYMIPEPSFSKLLWSNMETVAKSLLESVLAFGIAGIVMQTSLPEVVGYILMASLFSLVLVAANLLSKRIFKDIISQGILLTLYVVFILLVMTPGIVLAVLCAVFLPFGGSFLPLLAVCLWEALLAGVMLVLSRGILDTSDIESVPRNTK